MQNHQVKYGEWIQAGFNLYKANFAVIFTVSLIAVLLSVFTCGILAGPLAVGVTLVVLRLLDRSDPAPQIGDVFKGFELFLPAFLFFLGLMVAGWVGGTILGLVPFIGMLLSMVYSIFLGTAVMFGIFLISDRRMDAWTAARTSFETIQSNFWNFLGLFVVLSLLRSVGAVLCGVGVLLTLPIMTCTLAVAYREIFSAAESTAPVEPEVLPPSSP